jgi:dipeptidyl-peptidase-4
MEQTMNRPYLSVFVLSLVINLFAGKELTVKDIYGSRRFTSERLSNVKWYPDSRSFIFTKIDSGVASLYKHDVQSGQEAKWLDGKGLFNPLTKAAITIEDYTISETGDQILFKVESQYVWRRASLGKYLLYNVKSGKMTPVIESDDFVSFAKLSPDERKIGYTKDNNLFLKDLSGGQAQQITSDGNDNIINGSFDWVYEEEFGQDDGWRWSPDSKKIAFWRMDQKDVPTFSWTEFDSLYGSVRTISYPKAGDKNARVQIGVYHSDSGKTVWMDIGTETDQYIPRIQWTNDPDILGIQRLNRLQNKLELLLADVRTGQSAVILTERDSCWVDVMDNLVFLKSKKQFIWSSEQDGFNHIYLYDFNGKQLAQLTKGEWEVSRVSGVDEKRGLVYFKANKENTLQLHLFSVPLSGGKIRQITEEEGSHSAVFSPDFETFIHTFSNARTLTITQLADRKGDMIRVLRDGKIKALDEYDLAIPEYIQFQTSDGVIINAEITKPVDFDPSRKYPVFIEGYAGPGSQIVRNAFGNPTSRLWKTLLTQKGYILFTIDNRGTAGRGKAFKNLAYGDYGKYAVQDHIEAAKYLATLPYVEAGRIGVWGWSGGGYLTLMCLTKGAEFFKMGIAVAPVSDPRLYDTIYTERYMGLPQYNAAGYDSASALSWVNRFKGKLLIVHGASDDNVHIQNTMQFISALQASSKPFELMIYPGKNHSLWGRGIYLHLYNMMTEFILDNL